MVRFGLTPSAKLKLEEENLTELGKLNLVTFTWLYCNGDVAFNCLKVLLRKCGGKINYIVKFLLFPVRLA